MIENKKINANTDNKNIITLADEYITPENIGWVIGLLNELPDMKNEQAVANAISQGLNCEDKAVITEFWNFYQDYVSNDYPIDYLIRKIDLDYSKPLIVTFNDGKVLTYIQGDQAHEKNDL